MYLYYNPETKIGTVVVSALNPVYGTTYIQITDEMAQSVYIVTENRYGAEFLTVENGTASYNFSYYKFLKQQEFNTIFKDTDCITIDNTTCISVDNADNVALQKTHCDNQTGAENATKIKAQILGNGVEIFYTLENTTDMQALINNILCARAQYITLKEENQLKIDQATTQEQLNAIDLTNINLDFLDLR